MRVARLLVLGVLLATTPARGGTTNSSAPAPQRVAPPAQMHFPQATNRAVVQPQNNLFPQAPNHTTGVPVNQSRQTVAPHFPILAPTFSPGFGTAGSTPTVMPGSIPPPTPGRPIFTPAPVQNFPAATNPRPVMSSEQNNPFPLRPTTITPLALPPPNSSGIANTTVQTSLPHSQMLPTTGTKLPFASSEGAYASLPRSTFPISAYTPSYTAKMTAVTVAAAGSPHSSAGFAGWSPGLQNLGITPYGRGYCTDYAAATYSKITDKPMPALGNADQWYSEAQKNNLPTLPPTADAMRVAPPGSVIVWGGTGTGHVAVITGNNPTTQTITISEANWGGPRAGATAYEQEMEITKNFNTIDQRTLTYDEVAKMSGPTASGGTYTYNLEGFILPGSGVQN